MSGNVTGSLAPAPVSTPASAPSNSGTAPTNQNVMPPGAVNSVPKAERTGQKTTSPAEPTEPPGESAPAGAANTAGQSSGKTASDKDKAEPKMPELFEGKINGRVVRLPKEEWIRRAQLADSAQERFEAAAQKEKRADRIIANAKTNPLQALMDPELGLTKEQIIEHVEKWYTKEVIEPEGMSEEARKLRAAEEQLQAYRQKEEEAARKAKEDEEHKEVEGWRNELQRQIIEAIEGKRLKKTAFSIGLAAKYMRYNNLKGFNAPMDHIVNQVAKETREIVRGELEGLDYDGMVDLIGEAGIDVIRKAALNELRKRRQNGQFAPAAHQSLTPRSEGTKVSYTDVNNRLRQMRNGQ